MIKRIQSNWSFNELFVALNTFNSDKTIVFLRLLLSLLDNNILKAMLSQCGSYKINGYNISVY